MINELTLKNFKSWKEINQMRLAPITGLFGTNSSGKSSIFQSLLLLKQTLESADRSLPLHFGGEREYVELGSYHDVIHKHAADKSLGFAFKWDLVEQLEIVDPDNATSLLFKGQDMAFSTEIEFPTDKKLRVKRLGYTFDDREFTLSKKDKGNKYQLGPTKQGNGFRFIRTVGRTWDLPAPFKFHGFPNQVMTYYQNSEFLLDVQRQLEEQLSRIHYLGPLRNRPKRRHIWSGNEPSNAGQRGEQVVPAILAARDRGRYISPGYRKQKQTLEDRVAFWLKQLGLIHSFSVVPTSRGSDLFEVKVKRGPKSAAVLINDVGFGISQLLPVLVLCYYAEEGSTILLEEPEIHLHPSVQMGLADVFIDVIKNRNIQIIVESHSEHLLTRLQRRIAEEELEPDKVALYFCSSGPSASKLDPLELDPYGNITNWPKDFFGNQFAETASMQEAGLKKQIAAETEE